VSPELPEREAHVSKEAIDQAHAQCIAILLFHLIEPTKLESHSPNGLFTPKAPGDIRIDLMVNVKTQFFVYLPLDRRSPEQRA
jgi:hypothetical protein